MQQPACLHDSFTFRKTVKDSNRIIKMKPKPKARRSAVNKPDSQQDTTQVDDIDTTNLPPVLSNCVIFIDQGSRHNRLVAIAEGLGAAVQTNINQHTTHVVIEFENIKKHRKIISQASSKGIPSISPLWLFACYEKKELCPSSAYPYGLTEETYALGSDPTEVTEIEDPFGNPFIDYDALRARRANGGQTNLDGFISRTSKPETTSYSDTMESRYNTQSQMSMGPHVGSTPDTMDEHDEMAKEFFYNSSSSSSVSNNANGRNEPQESEEQLEEKRIKSQQRALKAREMLKRQMAEMQERSKEKEPPRRQRATDTGLNDRLTIWYGEQTVLSEPSKRNRN